MDTLTQMFFTDIKAYSAPTQREIILTFKGVPPKFQGQKDAPGVRVGSTEVMIPFGKRTWIEQWVYQALMLYDFHFTVIREK